MYHYTYKIHYSTGKFYIGVRTSKCLPEEDTKYLGSSKYTPNNLVVMKEILQVFPTRKQAIEHEVTLHKKYDIAKNPNFYNRAKQVSKKFDVTGIKQTKEHSLKIANALKGKKHDPNRTEKANKTKQEKFSKLRQQQGYVFKHSQETCKKISQSKLGKSKSDKGIKRDLLYKNLHYASRRNYPDSYKWVHMNLGEEYTTIYEMGHKYASNKKKPVAGFRSVIIGKLKSYLGWQLKSG